MGSYRKPECKCSVYNRVLITLYNMIAFVLRFVIHYGGHGLYYDVPVVLVVPISSIGMPWMFSGLLFVMIAILNLSLNSCIDVVFCRLLLQRFSFDGV